jgi:D-alanyl-D-alanine carboxypeptidase
VASFYLFILLRKKKKRKHALRFIIIALIFILLINSIILLFKKCDTQKVIKNIEVKTTSITKTTTTEQAGTTTNTTKKVNTTTKEITTNKINIPQSSKGYDITYSNGAYYVDNQLIVNKTYLLSSDFVPTNTYKKITPEMNGFCRTCIDKEAYNKWLTMKNDAVSIGLNIWIQSGYRSYSYQEGLYDQYVKNRGKEAADTFSARPGSSEHQSGLSFDLNSVDSSFANTEEGKWVNNNAYLYGYIIRFPKDKDNETGYKYESWHIRYVGEKLAKILYNNGDWITMENYYGLTSKY